jgi:hypothetical protein
MLISRHLKWPSLLPESNQNWNGLTGFNESRQWEKMSRKFVNRFPSFRMRTSRHRDTARLTGEFLQLLCERAKCDTKRRSGNLEPTEQVSDAITVLPTANMDPWAREASSLVQRPTTADTRTQISRLEKNWAQVENRG